MMTRKLRVLPVWFLFAAVAFLLPVSHLSAQATPGSPAQASPAPAKAPVATPIQLAPADAAKTPDATAKVPDRSQAYYHLALASTYEEEAVTQGRPELVTRAIEEYKLALNADPASAQLSNALADLYFRSGHPRDAESTARALLKNAPNDINAHKLLGRIYLRALSEGKNSSSSASSSGEALGQAITEFAKVVELEPAKVENRMILGQLYTVKQDKKKAEEQFKADRLLIPTPRRWC